MVRAGEAGGFLDLVLAQIADFRTRETDLKGKVKAALLYPMVLASLTVVVLIFLLTYFIPKFFPALRGVRRQPAGADARGHLRQRHRARLRADHRRRGGHRRGVGATGHRFRGGAALVRAGGPGVPVLGGVNRPLRAGPFTRMLGTLLQAGRAAGASLKTAKEAIGNQTLSDTVPTRSRKCSAHPPVQALATGGKLSRPA